MTDQPQQPKTVLLIEDELPFRQIYRDGLRIAGYNVIEADNGKAGLELIAQQAPDLIILDLIMPELSGFDVLTQLKNNDQHKHIPIIVYSVMAGNEDIERATKLGADDYTIKGVTPATEVVEKVKALIGDPTGNATTPVADSDQTDDQPQA